MARSHRCIQKGKSDSPVCLLRYSAPTIYDHAPKGTLCRIIASDAKSNLWYRQMSTDENTPRWEVIDPEEGLKPLLD